jgi:DNA repair protein RadC
MTHPPHIGAGMKGMIMELKTRKKQIKGSHDVAPIFRSILDAECEVDRDKEHFWVMGLDTKHRVQYLELVTLGLLNSSLVAPREVFRFAIMKGVACIVLVHNHPSGDPHPSQNDLAVTRSLKECGQILGIEVIDHIIVGEAPSYYSLREQGDM